MGAGVCSLVDAVDSGDPSAVGAAVSVIGNEQAASQLSTLSIYDDEQLETIVMLAARSGDVEMFYAVLRSLKRTLSQQEVGRAGTTGFPATVIAKAAGEGQL